jgi:hypothetical protein
MSDVITHPPATTLHHTPPHSTTLHRKNRARTVPIVTSLHIIMTYVNEWRHYKPSLHHTPPHSTTLHHTPPHSTTLHHKNRARTVPILLLPSVTIHVVLCPSSRRIPFGTPRGWKHEHDADIANFKFPITTDMNTDLKLDTLSFVYYFYYLHYDLLLVSLLRLHAICVFFSHN